MKIESADFFYLSMPDVKDIGDGSQDALLVRVRSENNEGWGECEAAPLVSLASWVCPRSHSACKPLQDSVLGQPLSDVEDIARIGNLVRENSQDILQTDHTLAGIDMALWDLMGRQLDVPVYELLGCRQSYPKTPYASQLFGDNPSQTLEKARASRQQGYRAAKFGWGPFGLELTADRKHLLAAREGLGADGILLVDAGTVWVDDVQQAALRIPALLEANALWFEEPFVSGAIDEYAELANLSQGVKLAGAEGCHNFLMAKQMIDHAGLSFVQIDAGRMGISSARRVAQYVRSRGLTYVNHTFTSHLALSASLQPFADHRDDTICEYPVELQSLAWDMTREHISPDANGQIVAPAAPGLGMTPHLDALRPYLVETEIMVKGKTLYRTPKL